jgi:hypothetical protein
LEATWLYLKKKRKQWGSVLVRAWVGFFGRFDGSPFLSSFAAKEKRFGFFLWEDFCKNGQLLALTRMNRAWEIWMSTR